jgi:hypothetical protein
MKKKLVRNVIIFLAIIIAGYFYFDEAKAYTLEFTAGTGARSYQGVNLNCNGNNPGGGNTCDYNETGNLTSSFTLSAIGLYGISCNNTGVAYDFNYALFNSATGALIASTTASNITCAGQANLNTELLLPVNVPISVTNGTNYWIGFQASPQGAGGGFSAYYGLNSLMSANLYSGGATPTLSFVAPIDTYTGGDFDNWLLNYDDSAQAGVQLRVKYGSQNLPVHYQYTDTLNTFFPIGGGNDVVPKANQLYKSQFATTTQWAVYAQLASPTGTIIAETDIIYIAITSSTPSYFASSSVGFFNTLGPEGNLFPTIDCSSYTFGLFSSSTLGAIGCIAKKTLFDVLGFFIIPHDQVIATMYDGQLEGFKALFPFNIFFAVRNAVDTAANNSLSSASSTLAWAYPIGGQTINISVSSSTLTTYLGSTIRNIYFTIARMFLWLMFIMAVWNITTKAFLDEAGEVESKGKKHRITSE